MQPTTSLRQLARNRSVVKIVGTTILTLVLLIPLGAIEDLIEERSQREQEVTLQLGQQWGPATTLRGPLLVVPARGTDQYRYIVPDELTVDGTVPVTERYRGIFRLPTYRGQLNLSGKFAIPRIQHRERPAAADSGTHGDVSTEVEVTPKGPGELLWEEASWVLIVGPDESSVVQAKLLAGANGNTDVPLQNSRSAFGIPGTILHAPVRPGAHAGGSYEFTASVDILGSEALNLAPLARGAQLALASNWPHPSFDGDRLPSERTVETTGFRARWELNAALLGVVPSYLSDVMPAPMLQSPVVSVRFVDAVSHYQKVMRGVKYALLVIVLTFVTFFLFEILAGLNIHPIQYLLVGCALTLFYLLLLSLTEHLAFSWSYLVAASCVVLLIGMYARAMLARSGRAVIFGGGLGAVYGLLYVILQEETLALLAGSWALFALLALVMFLTRNIDWASFGRTTKHAVLNKDAGDSPPTTP